MRSEPIQKVMGADALRYFLLREVVFGQDGSFSYDALIGRYNSDLANGLGNLASRTLTMVNQYRKGEIPQGGDGGTIAPLAAQTIQSAQSAYESFEFSKGLESIWGLISAVDKFIVERAPWKLARSAEADAPAGLDDTLYTAAEALRIVTALLYPVLPEEHTQDLVTARHAGAHRVRALRIARLGRPESRPEDRRDRRVFPRIELKPAVDKMRELEAEVTAAQAVLMGKKPEAAAAPEGVARIGIDDFLKVDLRVGQVLTAQPVKGSTKLMQMTVDLGEGTPRTIVAASPKPTARPTSSIAKW